MRTVLFTLAVLGIVVPAGAQTPSSVFECRNTTRPALAFPVIRSEEDKRISFQSRWFEPDQIKVFGLPVTFLSETINGPNDDKDFNDFYYITVLSGKIDEVRWLVERAHSDLRCVRIPANGISDGNSYSCLRLGQGSLNHLTISVYSANGRDDIDGIKEGIVVACSFDDLKD
jgi:hypothetical protein